MYVSKSTKAAAEIDIESICSKSIQAVQRKRSSRRAENDIFPNTSVNAKGSIKTRTKRAGIQSSRGGRIVIEPKHRISLKNLALFTLSVTSLASFALLVIYLAQALLKLKS